MHGWNFDQVRIAYTRIFLARNKFPHFSSHTRRVMGKLVKNQDEGVDDRIVSFCPVAEWILAFFIISLLPSFSRLLTLLLFGFGVRYNVESCGELICKYSGCALGRGRSSRVRVRSVTVASRVQFGKGIAGERGRRREWGSVCALKNLGNANTP